MKLFELTDKLPEKTQSQIGLMVVDLLEEYDALPQEEKSDQKKSDYRKVVKTDWNRKAFKMFKVKDYYIAPKFYSLDDQNKKSVGRFAYVSLIDLCKKYLKNKFIRELLLKEQQQKNENYVPSYEKFTSILDSEQFWRLLGYLKIEIFFDDAQLAPSNGLGSGRQKYYYVYVTFVDMPYEYCCHRNNVEQVLMVKRSDLDKINPKYRIQCLYKVIVKDLLHLMNVGIEVDGTRFYATVSNTCADNLGLYEWAGFCCSFKNEAFVCRQCGLRGKCKCKRGQKRKLSSVADNNLPLPIVKRKKTVPMSTADQLTWQQPKCGECKTIQDIDSVAKLLNAEDFESKPIAKSNGLIRPFPFRILPNIDVTNLSAPDIMHDKCEGILPNIAEILLHMMKDFLHAIHRGTINQILEVFNDKFRQFNFYEGKQSLRWHKSSFKVDGEAIQVIIFVK